MIIWNRISPWPDEWWSHYFFITKILIAGLIGIVSTVWFSIGGTVDLIRLFKRLDEKKDDISDDGRVTERIGDDDEKAGENPE